MKQLAIIALLTLGCGASDATPTVELASATPEPEPEPAACGMAFDPVPELLAATKSAAERWSAATGCDVRVEAGGVPVVLVNGLTTASGKRAAGAWRHTVDSDVCRRLDIDNDLGGPITIAHEMGHCLGAHGHAKSGLMAVGAPGGINAASLELVCAALPCSAFAPEL